MSNESKTLLTQIQELQATNDTVSAAFEGFKTEQAALVADLNAKLTEAVAARDEAEKSVCALSDELGAVKAELDGAKALLANPAFADALSNGSAGAGLEGGVAGEGGAGDQMSPEAAQAEYAKLTDAKAKQEFRRANWKALGIKEEK